MSGRRQTPRQAAARIAGDRPFDEQDTDSDGLVEGFYSLVLLLPPAPAGAEFVQEHRTRAAAHAAPPRPDTGRTFAEPADTPVAHRLPRRVTVALGAALVIVPALVFAVVLLILPRPSFAPDAALYLHGTGAARDAQGVALVGSNELVVYASGLSRLEPGYRYVVWSVEAGTYRRVGSMVTLGDGRVRLVANEDTIPDQLEITIEPSASTDGPHGPTLLAGFL